MIYSHCDILAMRSQLQAIAPDRDVAGLLVGAWMTMPAGFE